MTGNPQTVRQRAVTQARLLVQRAGYDVTRENFRHRFVYTLQQHGITTVLDIGANSGQFGNALRRAGYTGRIVSVEPLQSPFEELRATAATDPLWTVERAAVADVGGVITMNVAGNSVSSSVLPMLDRHTDAAPTTRYVSTEDVVATTVEELVHRHGVDPQTAILKVDVQGFETAVLTGARTTLKDFAAVRTELSLVPLYEGQALMPEIVALLADHGFALWLMEPGFTEPNTRRTLQLDGTFYRD